MLGEIEEFLTGGRSRTVARDLLTVVFSDIVGSTGHAARLGDARWRDLLGAHQTAVRREIDRFGGREVKTIGDAFLIAFDGAPSHAVRCAEAIVEAVRAVGLEVRVGLHTGECEVIGHDVGGMAVHIAARVAALAAPGEVLASGTTLRDGRRRRAQVRGARHAGAQRRPRALAAVRAGRRLNGKLQTATFAMRCPVGVQRQVPRPGGGTPMRSRIRKALNVRANGPWIIAARCSSR